MANSRLALLLAVLAAAPAGGQEAPVTLRGRVVDAQTGEPIARARVAIVSRKLEAVADARGRFSIVDVAPGDVEIAVTTVGYGVVRKVVHVTAAAGELEIRLSQEALRRAEGVTVTVPPFAPADPAAPAAQQLEGTELENLSSVLVDDPLRSVQSLPGVAAADDFGATFSSRGLGFSNVGFHLDGVLLGFPFHTVRDVNDAYSLTLLNGDLVDSVSLMTGGAPARYGDRIGPVLAVRSRDGSREQLIGRATAGVTGLRTTLEGPIGSGKRTSWLFSVRKSYVDYVLERLRDPGVVLGFHDAAARLTRQASPSHTLSLGLIHGRSRWRRTNPAPRPQDSLTADAGTDVATLRWRWLPSPRSGLETVAFISRETGRDRNLDGTDRARSASTQWGLRADATRVRGQHRLEGGILLRRLSEDAVSRGFDGRSGTYFVTERYDVRSVHPGAYLQDTWSGAGGKLAVTLGARAERYTRETRLLPRAAFTWRISGATSLIAATGEYAQFPVFAALFGRHGNPGLHAERARHAVVALEQGLGERTRVRVEAYDERVGGLLFETGGEWRIEGGRIVPPGFEVVWRNALSGHSRGVEVLVQRRSANKLSGWISYSLGHARWRDTGYGLRFDSDFDQRHALNVFGSWRISDTWNLSTDYRYGSGFPVAGFYEARPDGLFLSSQRNGYRPGSYGRWDVRANKAFLFSRWKLTLHAEVINLLGRTNTRYTGLDEVDARTGRVLLEGDTLFPFLPAAAVTVEF